MEGILKKSEFNNGKNKLGNQKFVQDLSSTRFNINNKENNIK